MVLKSMRIAIEKFDRIFMVVPFGNDFLVNI